MRILSIVLLLFLFVSNGFGQLDYPDYRQKKENFSKIPDKKIRDELASFTMAGVDESIGKPALSKVPVSSYGKDYLSFNGNNVKVIVYTAPFNPAGHKLQKVDEHVVKIDNKAFYGNYGNLPKTYIKSISVVIGTDSVEIPTSAYFDIYDLNFGYRDASGTLRSTSGIYFSSDKSMFYIYLLNRANEGNYEVTWVIQNKKYLRRVLDYGF